MSEKSPVSALPLIEADNPAIQYTGRIDFSQPKRPRFWSPGVYIQAKFTGTACDVLLHDERLYGTSHNFVEIAIDDQPSKRIELMAADNALPVAENLSDGPHTLTICKDTEAGIGYLDFIGLHCAGLVPLPKPPKRKIEFIGDSITAGAGMDTSEIPCGSGQWYDQHNAYRSYGPTTARHLNAQWHLSAVAGIGLIHSCCDMKITMPQVFDKLNQRENTQPWDFSRYQPDVVTICLGQNDGVQDTTTFCDAYVHFIERVRVAYPKADIVCITSPMGDPTLTTFLQDNLTKVVAQMHQSGDMKVHSFFFSQRYHKGCGDHPNMEEHQSIANELTTYLKKTLHW
jgi:lysophospholipase L1-like esterase